MGHILDRNRLHVVAAHSSKRLGCSGPTHVRGLDRVGLERPEQLPFCPAAAAFVPQEDSFQEHVVFVFAPRRMTFLRRSASFLARFSATCLSRAATSTPSVRVLAPRCRRSSSRCRLASRRLSSRGKAIMIGSIIKHFNWVDTRYLPVCFAQIVYGCKQS